MTICQSYILYTFCKVKKLKLLVEKYHFVQGNTYLFLRTNYIFNFLPLTLAFCWKDLCRADPKLFTAQWIMLLPSNDVLQHRWIICFLCSCLWNVVVFEFFVGSLVLKNFRSRFLFSSHHLFTLSFFFCRKYDTTLMSCLLFDPSLKVSFILVAVAIKLIIFLLFFFFYVFMYFF